MRVLFTPMPWPTHYYPMMGLVWAFRALGHDVRVAGQPPLIDTVTRTGVMAVSVGGGYDLTAGMQAARKATAKEMAAKMDLKTKMNLRGDGQPPPEVLRQLVELAMVKHIDVAEDMVGDLVAFARWWRPDLVITDPLVYAAPLAAAAAGAPLIRHLWGIDAVRHMALPGSGVSEEDDPRARWPERLVELYSRYDVKPQPDVAAHTLDICPSSLQLPGVPNRIPMRFVPYNGTQPVPSWLLEPVERPRVCITWGTTTTATAGPEAFAVPQILDALRGFDVDILVTVTRADRERLSEVPLGMRVVEAMPLDMILPTCAAIIDSSGAGTALTAAYHGVPQVTLPQFSDEGLMGERLAALGASIDLNGNQVDAGAIKSAMTTILDTDGPRTAAGKLREEILAQPAPAEVVATLEALAR